MSLDQSVPEKLVTQNEAEQNSATSSEVTTSIELSSAALTMKNQKDTSRSSVKNTIISGPKVKLVNFGSSFRLSFEFKVARKREST
jgi:hypothetical protein